MKTWRFRSCTPTVAQKKKHDGIPDLVVEFDVNELVASLGTVKNGQVRVLTVNGTMNLVGTTITTNIVSTNINSVVPHHGGRHEQQRRRRHHHVRGPGQDQDQHEEVQAPQGLKNPF